VLTGIVLALVAARADASSLVISNGYYYDPAGVFAARHSLTKVDVNNNGGNSACENALNTDGTWAQDQDRCAATPGSYNYHTFCGCSLRYGWNGPRGGVWMLDIESY
jgi:hypothetical protein